MSTTHTFQQQLWRACLAHKAGLLLGELLRVAGRFALLLTLLVVADYFAAFSAHMLIGLEVLGACLLAFWMAQGLWRVLRFSRRDAARAADARAGNQRRHILSAYELSRSTARTDDPPGMNAYLLGRIHDRASAQLAALRMRDLMPLDFLKRCARVCLLQVALGAALLVPAYRASAIILARIFSPHADIPPYSRYNFSILPDTPRVIYGDDVEIAVEITGAPVRAAVWLATRQRGEIRKAACFQESTERFAQKLEQVIEPVEFCFMVGRARSRWHSVELLLEPQVAMARAIITPPAYSRLPPGEIWIGRAPLNGLKGSRIRLDVSSNRPLSGGQLRVQPAEGEAVSEVSAQMIGPHTARFEWELIGTADIAVTLRDVRGTPNRAPFELRQTILPDAPPQAVITEPQGFALATPSAKVQISGYAEDDLGLQRVNLVQALAGYRDRARPIGLAPAERQHTMESTIDLATLGVEPGQTLEFYLEAQDFNPDWTGRGESEVARIQIISEKEYMEMLRARTTAQGLRNRYLRATESLQQVREALKTLAEAAAATPGDPAAISNSIAAVQNAAAQAARQYRLLADDCPLFDIENNSAQLFGKIADELLTVEKQLGYWDTDDAQLPDRVTSVQNQVNELARALNQEALDVEQVISVGRVIELAREYNRLIALQENLVRRLARYADTATLQDAVLLRQVRDQQAEIQEQLAGFCKVLEDQAGVLPEDYKDLATDIRQFLEKLKGLEVSETMSGAQTAADNQNGPEARRLVNLALEKMRQMLSNCPDNGFAGMCQNRMCFKPKDGHGKCLQQMMDAWKMGMGNMGGGGATDDGYWMGGNSPLNLQAFGPMRGSYENDDSLRQGKSGGALNAADNAGKAAAFRMQGATTETPDHRAAQWGRVPPKYRDAIKKYFGEEEENK